MTKSLLVNALILSLWCHLGPFSCPCGIVLITGIYSFMIWKTGMFPQAEMLVVLWLHTDQHHSTGELQSRPVADAPARRVFLGGISEGWGSRPSERSVVFGRSVEGGAIFKVTFFHSEKCPAPGQVQTLVQTRHLLRLLPVLSAHSRWVEFPQRKPSHIYGFFWHRYLSVWGY